MGASIKIQDTNLDIAQFSCSQCQQKFTQQDKETDNWDLWWDTSRKVAAEKIVNGWNWLRVTLEVNDLTHKFWIPENSSGKGYYECPEPAEKSQEVNHE